MVKNFLILNNIQTPWRRRVMTECPWNGLTNILLDDIQPFAQSTQWWQNLRIWFRWFSFLKTRLIYNSHLVWPSVSTWVTNCKTKIKKKYVEHQTGKTGVEECDNERAGQKKKKKKALVWKTEAAHEKVGLSNVLVQRGPSQQAAPLISLINRTKTTKQMGP